MPRVYVNGSLVAAADAVVSVFDHGLIVGDGVFETVLLHEGHPFALTRHLERLARSITGLGIPAISEEEVRGAIDLVVRDADLERGRIRITVTSGVGPLGSSRGDNSPTLIVALEQAEIDSTPCRVEIAPWRRNELGALSGLKTTSYAENARALALAHEAGASEAIFANLAHNLCEGTGSNVFFARGGQLATPPLTSGCLAGTTRDLLVERLSVKEEDLVIETFSPESIDEAFLASSIRGVQPITSIGDAPFSAVPGPLTSRAMDCFAKLLQSEIDP